MPHICLEQVRSFFEFLSYLAIIAGVFISLYLFSREKKKEAARHFFDYYRQYATNKTLSNLFYDIAYEKFKYPKNIKGKQLEKDLDLLLFLYEYMARIYLKKGVSLAEFNSIVGADFLCVYQNFEVRKHLLFWENWYSQRRIKIKPFYAFIKVGKILEKKYSFIKVISKERQSRVSGKYL